MCSVPDYADARALHEGNVDGGGAGAKLGVGDVDGKGAGGGAAEEGSVQGEGVRLVAG